MAGPTSSVLLETIPTKWIWEEIENVILNISDEVEGNDFWVTSTESINGSIKNIQGRPFGIEKNKIDSGYYNYSEEEILKIKDEVGINPKFDLVFYAMCNREVDHKILGELTLYIAEKFDGLINFCGQISMQSDEMIGKTWEIPYKTSTGMTAVYHIADVDFMKGWLCDKNFRMIK